MPPLDSFQSHSFAPELGRGRKLIALLPVAENCTPKPPALRGHSR